MQESVVLIWIT